MTRHEPLPSARFAVEQTLEGEQIRVRPKPRIFVTIFSLFWLTGWSFAGISLVRTLLTSFDPFLAFMLPLWAWSWLWIAFPLLWMAVGSETLRVVGSNLEVADHIFSYARRRLYQGSQIRNLAVPARPDWRLDHSTTPHNPFRRRLHEPAIKFDYGPRTIYAAFGLDSAEGAMIVEKLGRRLPTATR